MTRAGVLRTEIRRSAASAARAFLRCGILSLLGLCAYWSIRLAWADHLSLDNSLASRGRAVQMAPAVATFYERLADKRDGLGDLRQAVSLDPESAARRMRLGLRAELAGNLPLAEDSLLAAAARSHLYQPRYLLAQYYFRRQNAEGFWRWSREAMEMAPGDVSALLDLNWRMQRDAAFPARPEIKRQYLTFLGGKREWETAQRLAGEIAAAATMTDRPVLLDYCDRRLTEGDGPGAMKVWNTLCRRGLLPYRALDPAAGPYLTGGSFDRAPLETGFDWRFHNPPGIACVLRNGAIRLRFSGSQQEESTILWQYIPAQRYRVKFEMHPKVEGLVFRVSDGKTIGKVELVYRRPLGSVPFEGAVAITALSIEPAP